MEAIIVAAITLAGGVLTALIQRMRRENSEQHAEGRAILHDVRDDVRETKADVREIKGDVRALDGRVSVLEHH